MSIHISDPEPHTSSPSNEATQQAANESKAKLNPTKLLLVLAVVLIFAATAAWTLSTRATAIERRDFAFLPNNATVVVSIKGRQLIESNLFRDLKPYHEKLAEKKGLDSSEFFGRIEDRLESITVGITAPPSLSDTADTAVAGVLRFRKPFLFLDALPAKVKASCSAEESIDGRKLHVAGNIAFCQIDEFTVALGDLPSLRDVVKRGFVEANVSEPMREALQNTDFSQLLTVIAAGSSPSIDELKQLTGSELPQSLVVNADVDQDIHLTANIVMQSEPEVEALLEQVEQFLKMAKSRSPEAAVALETLEVTTTGPALNVALTIRGLPLVAAVKARSERVVNPTFARCQQHIAELDSAIERYYSEKGEVPVDLDGLGEYLRADFPRHCDVHNGDYVIHSKQHRAVHGTPANLSSPRPSVSNNPH